MFDLSSESAGHDFNAVVDVVQDSLSQEELEFGMQPNGELLGRYALEAFIDLVASDSEAGC